MRFFYGVLADDLPAKTPAAGQVIDYFTGGKDQANRRPLSIFHFFDETAAAFCKA